MGWEKALGFKGELEGVSGVQGQKKGVDWKENEPCSDTCPDA